MTDKNYIFAKMQSFDEGSNIFDDADPFAKNWEDLKGLSGLNTNFKRRTSRTEKATVSQIPRDASGNISSTYIDQAMAQPSGNDAQSKRINPGLVYRNGYGIFDVITPPYNLYELSSYYDSSFANHAAIDAKVANTVGLGYRFEMTPTTLMKMDGVEDDTAKLRAKKRIERLKVQLQEWLEDCNDEDSFTKTMEKVVTDLEATGNGYVEVGRTVAGDIGYVGHIPSTTIRVRRLRDGFMQIIGGTVVYFRNFQATNPNPVTDDPRPNEIIHIKEYSPLNTYYGVPDILAAIPSLVGDQMASQYNIDYFENKAVPRYVVTVKGAQLSADSEDKLFRFLQTGLKGQNHRTLYIPLPGDSDGNKVEFNMQPIENGVQEASFEKYRKMNRDDILIAHQVPLSKLGGIDAASVAAAMSQDRTFKEQVARPKQSALEKVINKIIKEKTDLLHLKFNEMTLTDELAQSQIHERYLKTQVLLPNEVREAIGKPQRDGGDDPLELSARQAADARANIMDNRERDTERSNNQSDGPGAVTGRNPQGEGPASE